LAQHAPFWLARHPVLTQVWWLCQWYASIFGFKEKAVISPNDWHAERTVI
jgi:hypothetical protein